MKTNLTTHIAEAIRHFSYLPDDNPADLAEHLVVQAGLGKLEETAALKERLAIVAYLRARAEKARREADNPSLGVAFGAFFDQMADDINSFKDKDKPASSNANEVFTPDNPMYPDVHVHHIGCVFVLRDEAAHEIRRRHGHNAANWFLSEVNEKDTVDEMLTFIKSTVRVS